MIKEEDVFYIGKIGRPHGVRGDVLFHFTDDIFDRVDTSYFILEIDGIFVPFFFEKYSFHNHEMVLIKFCDIDTQNQARNLTGCKVFFPRALSDSDESSIGWSQAIGFTLINVATDCPIGVIAHVDDTTLNILFELEDGALIPANEELITHIDRRKREITIQLPEGLLEI